MFKMLRKARSARSHLELRSRILRARPGVRHGLTQLRLTCLKRRAISQPKAIPKLMYILGEIYKQLICKRIQIDQRSLKLL